MVQKRSIFRIKKSLKYSHLGASTLSALESEQMLLNMPWRSVTNTEIFVGQTLHARASTFLPEAVQQSIVSIMFLIKSSHFLHFCGLKGGGYWFFTSAVSCSCRDWPCHSDTGLLPLVLWYGGVWLPCVKSYHAVLPCSVALMLERFTAVNNFS